MQLKNSYLNRDRCERTQSVALLTVVCFAANYITLSAHTNISCLSFNYTLLLILETAAKGEWGDIFRICKGNRTLFNILS